MCQPFFSFETDETQYNENSSSVYTMYTFKMHIIRFAVNSKGA